MHPTFNWPCAYLSMLGLQLNHVSKKALGWHCSINGHCCSYCRSLELNHDRMIIGASCSISRETKYIVDMHFISQLKWEDITDFLAGINVNLKRVSTKSFVEVLSILVTEYGICVIFSNCTRSYWFHVQFFAGNALMTWNQEIFVYVIDTHKMFLAMYYNFDIDAD